LFLTLKNSQTDTVLSGTVWLDETYYPVISSQIAHKEDGTKYRGLSRNQICIGVATDKRHTVCFVEGTGKPSQKKTFDAFVSHIEAESWLIHDKETTHKKLVSALNLVSQAYAAYDLKGLKDNDNPLDPVNNIHSLLKKFLRAHSGFNRDSLQDYLNLFVFVRDPPSDMLEKVEKVVNLAFQNPKYLRYRDQVGLSEGFED
jgi:hypothetical protein